jgi:hypothetical protein
MAIWTHGVWTVKPGREEEFVRTWLEMARAGSEVCQPLEAPAPGPGTAGRLPELRALAEQRGDRSLQASIGTRFDAIERELLESFEATTLEEVPLGG